MQHTNIERKSVAARTKECDGKKKRDTSGKNNQIGKTYLERKIDIGKHGWLVYQQSAKLHYLLSVCIPLVPQAKFSYL